MDTGQELTERFKDAIRKSLPQCPLIGPKWFRYEADRDPPVFRFVCIGKLVKATGMSPKVLTERVVKNLDLHGFDADVRITEENEIQVRLGRPKGGDD